MDLQSVPVERSAWLQLWARLGFAIGGIVYVITGVLAIMVAYGKGEQASPEGAIGRIGTQPFGHVLLLVVAIGLLGYASWCFIQAIFDTDGDGKDLKGIAVRIGECFGGIAYTGLAVIAFHRMRGAQTGQKAAVHWTARVLEYSWGQWLVGLAGIVVVIVGIVLIVYGAREGFRQYLNLGETSGSESNWIVRFGKWGYCAQGVVFCIIGAFLVSAAVHADAREARGLDGSLAWLAQQNYGPWLLGVVAAGLGAYGLFMLVEARYRRLT